MDIIIKKTIRELIKKINKEEGVTVILTSHDMGDVEDICERIIVINHGEIIYDNSLKKIKENFIKKKVVKVETNKPLIFKEREGIKVINKGEFELEAEIDTDKVDFNTIAAGFFGKNDIEDLTIEEPPIEEIIEKIYKSKPKKAR
jgi:ABC-2 type transport system ATP-binding protein